MPAFKFEPTVPYAQLVVATVDTVRYSYLLTAALDVQKPMLFAGRACRATSG